MYSIGLDDNCNPIPTKCIFVEYLPENKIKRFHSGFTGREIIQDCIIIEDGVKIVYNSNILKNTADELDLVGWENSFKEN